MASFWVSILDFRGVERLSPFRDLQLVRDHGDPPIAFDRVNPMIN